MAFTKRDVKDRLVQYPRRYQLVEVQPGIFDLIPVPGTITEEGTPINKAYLQPLEDGLADALEKTGDGKDVTVTFTEAATEAHIASGEKLSVMFGKILKKFKSIVPITLGGTGANSVAGARNALGLGNTIGALPVANGGTGSTTAANARTALGVPPINHANSGSTYGLGSPTLHGHVKAINALTQASHVDGTALSAYQGKVLNDLIDQRAKVINGSYTGDGESTRIIPLPFTPKLVVIIAPGFDQFTLAIDGTSFTLRQIQYQQREEGVTSNGFIIAGGTIATATNRNGQVYNYVAIG